MSDTCRIRLKPADKTLVAPRGAPLRAALFEHGAEFPCGGQGRCRGCRVRVLEGDFPVNAAMRERLSAAEIVDGWRLACQCSVGGDATLEMRQWEMPVLVDDTAFPFVPARGLGVAVDLGTTTLAAQLLDLSNGCALGVRTALNPQARWGGDVMSRVQSAVHDGTEAEQRQAVRHEIGRMVAEMLAEAGADPAALRRVVLVGNTVMHHLFCGVDVEPMAHVPFEPQDPGLKTFAAADLGWPFPAAEVRFLPGLGGFVGGDVLAGILATRLHERKGLCALVDLGTNGEIVVARDGRLLCASTAAGPAFEGAGIRHGMRAASGAIWQVRRANGTEPGRAGENSRASHDGAMRLSVLGGGRPRGLCGSGLVDAVAVALDLDRIRPTGRLRDGSHEMPLLRPVSLTQADIRELQLAKGAIAAGIALLLRRFDAETTDVDAAYLAGAFGNYVNRASAHRIGLLGFPTHCVEAAGNTALLGAKIALFAPEESDPAYSGIRDRVAHVSLHREEGFQDVFTDCMAFPPVREPALL